MDVVTICKFWLGSPISSVIVVFKLPEPAFPIIYLKCTKSPML